LANLLLTCPSKGQNADRINMAVTSKPKSAATGSAPKDLWDKVDIIAKALIPVAVALSVLLWNSERTKRDTAAQMITIATSILTSPPENSAPNALRQWAISVLQSPQDPPTLTDEAAASLAIQTIPWGNSNFDGRTMEEILRRVPTSVVIPALPTPDP